MSEGFIKAICYKEALFAWTTFLQISQMQSAGIIIVLTEQTCWDHVSLTVPHFFSQLRTEAYTKYQRLVKRLYLLQSVSIKTEEYITLTGSKYIICSSMFFLFKKKKHYKVLCLNRDIEKISVFTVPSYLQQKLQRQHT